MSKLRIISCRYNTTIFPIVKEIVEVERPDSIPPKPEYTDEDLEQITLAVQRMTTLFALNEADWTPDCIAVIRKWLLDTDHLMLTIFYDGDKLTACLAFPLAPIFDLSYFLRDPNHIFTVDGFHDEITFGRLNEDIDGTMLSVLSEMYAPIFFGSNEMSKSVKGQFCGALNAFLSYLTGLHFKMSGITVLYIPTEALIVDVENAVEDSDLIKRLEALAVNWIGSIRQCLNDKELLVPHELMCPPDHYDFFTYRCEYFHLKRISNNRFSNLNFTHR